MAAPKLFFLVSGKYDERRSALYVMSPEDFADRNSRGTIRYFKKGEGSFDGAKWVKVTGWAFRAQLFTMTTGETYYVFADRSAISKTTNLTHAN